MKKDDEIERLRSELARQYGHRRKQNDEIERLRKVIASAYYDTDPASVLEPEVTG